MINTNSETNSDGQWQSAIETALDTATEKLHAASASARLDAEVLLSHVLNQNRSFLRAWPEKMLNATQLGRYKTLINARAESVPVAYLTGYKEFWSRRFQVSRDVLVPRPETELLIEMALEILPTEGPVSVLELGTGSGVIATSLALERPNAMVQATDICTAALDIARQNAKYHKANHIGFFESDWFDSIPKRKFDLIISNPPYVAQNDPHLSHGDLVHEPEIALASGACGMDALTRIGRDGRNWLRTGGHLILEHGYQQTAKLNQVLLGLGYRDLATQSDLQKHPRATRCRWIG